MNCAFLLSSCDNYEDTWDPFFRLLSKYWPDIPCPVYLNTESKHYTPSVSLPFSVTTLNNPGKLYWSERMLRALRSIPEDYVFLVLDDLFLKSPVDGESFAVLLEKMASKPDIASIQFNASRAVQEGREASPVGSKIVLSEVPRNGWKTLFNPTIWRKSVLMKWLRRHESIWGFELYGSQRARFWNYRERVLSLDAPLVYDYLWVKNCSVIVNGKWLAEPAVDDLFSENGIAVDFDSRGRITVEEYRSKSFRDVMKRYTPLQIVQRCFYRVCSFF